MDAGLVDVELPDDEPVASVTSLEDARGKRPVFDTEPDKPARRPRRVGEEGHRRAWRPVQAGQRTHLSEASSQGRPTDRSRRREPPRRSRLQRAAEEADRLAAEKLVEEAEARLSSEIEAWLEHETWLAEQARDCRSRSPRHAHQVARRTTRRGRTRGVAGALPMA